MRFEKDNFKIKKMTNEQRLRGLFFLYIQPYKTKTILPFDRFVTPELCKPFQSSNIT